MSGIVIYATQGDPVRVEVNYLSGSQLFYSRDIHGKLENRPEYAEGNNEVLTPDYIIGFTDGEGCFYVQIRTDHRIVLRYFITQRFDNKEVLEKIRNFFKVGYVHLKKQEWGREYRRFRRPTYVFEVTKQDHIQKVIVPFFKKHSLQGVKRLSFEKFARIADLVKGRQDTRKVSEDKLKLIWQLKKSMNQLNTSARPVREIRSPGGNGKKP